MKTKGYLLTVCMMVSESLSLSLELNVSLKPLSGSRKLIYAGPEETVIMNCSIDGITDPSFKWTMNDSLLVDQENSVLKVRKVSQEQEGDYNCHVTSGLGTLRSETITLKLAEMRSTAGPSPRKEIQDTDLLQCDVSPYSVPPAQVFWIRNRKQLGREAEHLYSDINGHLVFMYKTPDDRRALYQCMVTNIILNNSVTGVKRYFSSGLINARQQTRPILVSSTEEVTGVEGEGIVMECVFTGDPIPQISWQKVGFDEPVISSNKNQLVLTNVQVSDTGSYKCTASNTLGREAGTVKLRVKARASAKEVPKSKTVLSGSDVILRCGQATGDINWYIDGTSIQNSGHHLNISEDKTSLTIHSSENRTNGLCVQCDVTDDRSYSLYSACFKYVESVDQLPTTQTMTDRTTVTSTIAKVADSPVMPMWVIILVTVAAVFVVSAALVITVRLIRKHRRRRKKKVDSRVSTVSCTLPTRTSLLCEINLLEEKH